MKLLYQLFFQLCCDLNNHCLDYIQRKAVSNEESTILMNCTGLASGSWMVDIKSRLHNYSSVCGYDFPRMLIGNILSHKQMLDPNSMDIHHMDLIIINEIVLIQIDGSTEETSNPLSKRAFMVMF